MNTITVKVGKLPGRINDYALEANSDVQDALNAAELDAEGYEVRVDGELVANLDTTVQDGSSVFLSRRIKGN